MREEDTRDNWATSGAKSRRAPVARPATDRLRDERARFRARP